jgi:hypothetical protein
MFDCSCPDPGAVSFGSHLSVLDGQFCEKRLTNTAGLLQAFVTGSGAYQLFFTNEPSPALTTFSVTAGSEFGNLIAINADGKMRQLDFPNVAGLVVQTNASGQLVASALPAATIPDPLTVTTLNATTANIGTLSLTGTAAMSGLATGTITQAVGLDGSGNLIKGGSSSGVQTASFFESPSGSSIATPNSGAVAGGFLIIGNMLFDSGGNIAQVQDAQTIKVLVAGTYQIDWFGQLDGMAGRTGQTIMLTKNGTVLNNGNGSATTDGTPAGTFRTTTIAGKEPTSLAVNDLLKLQIPSSAGTSLKVYQARMVLTKIG